VISPILSNIYLDKLDKFVEETLIPAYTRGKARRRNHEYTRLNLQAFRSRRKGEIETAAMLKRQMQQMPSIDPEDPDYRRLYYIRYADDVRHLTRYEILLSEKRGSEEMTSGSSHLPGRENGREKEHVSKAGSV
jgi:hypothetical protein